MLPEEAAVALSFNGTTQAVMMATPADLEDFAYGFALTEGIATAAEIERIDIEQAGQGLDVQTWLFPHAQSRLADRRRTMAGPVGCGLCGIDSVEQALRPVARVAPSAFRMTPDQVHQAAQGLRDRQPLHDLTHAAHCAALWQPGGLTMVREDVGRHNALDKLIGAATRPGAAPLGDFAVVLTCRVSVDMVQKAAAFGAPVIIAMSAPTAHAADLADEAGITLIAGLRGGQFHVYSHSDRLTEVAHVR
ncbi:formate dehydrogenase accessory sulfurtransferase FdhD [Rhodobacter sp. Har01]|nr:formate dehydrogenase accessory sulfurtransferase FdhD [Rhodobacter sp. Har01]MCB6178078.1 formate dehydrogenase accessory sulfurtransferase FdhD [Rhodobacter sp. Har01]